MPWSDILGHALPLSRLRASAAAGRLAHAYAFIGPAGIGKKKFAIETARALLCERHADAELDSCGECSSCRQVTARTHPDLFLVGLPEGKSELPIRLFVGEDERRGREGLCFELSLRPMSARRRVAIIDDADCLNDESANCLLKTLEEPPRDSLLILVAASTDALLPTIRSRCQVLTFQPLADDEVETLLVREGLVENDAEAAEISKLCDGSLETARQLIDPELRAQRGTMFDLLSAEPFASAALATNMVEGVESSGGERSSQRQAAGWLLRFCIEFYRRALLVLAQGPGGRPDVPQVARYVARLHGASLDELDRVGELLERCLLADRQLAGNASIPLCLEALCDDLAKLQRG